MTDVADEIRKTIQGVGARHPLDPDEAYRKLHAHVWGVLIDAHRALTQRDGAILEQDVRILNVVTAWMEDVRGRR
jgi:hypothetical protein